ncbi:acyltransferase family protein [Alteribacillus sp. HJP-4]|uniref:acyltransferase family protein n=1 Tax=Alteribacillus sp. HJP-4 TaxID=2775394 RepID=UPI0035CCDA30
MTDLRIPEKKFRPEIEGVRAVAALLVAVYHIWLGSVSGGVDVFFIVSGYLITTSLLTKMEREGQINFFEYVLGLARRLFPLAFIVLLITTLFSIIILPQSQWGDIISQVFASAFYYENWQLANNAVDYLAQNNQASPFQHFWALSIQGQFYITWPFIIMAAYTAARKMFKTPVRKTLLVLLSTIFILSISYSVYITAVNQPWAYFDTFARVWEFSLGGILALLIPYVTINKAASFVLGWLGLAVVCLTGILLPVSNVFPGFAALLPTMGVVLVIIAAENGSRFGAEKLLGSKPFVSFGSISYGFYLWHWPLLIFYYTYTGADVVSVQHGLAMLFLTFTLSFLSGKILEKPVRKINVKQSKGKLAAILVSFMVPVLVVGTAWGAYLEQTQASFEENEEVAVEDFPGARSISDGIEPNEEIDPLSMLAEIKGELPEFYADEDCFTDLDESGVSKCSYGETENPEHTVALVGGSHSGHWFPALQEMSKELNLQIDVYNKNGCRFTNEDFDGAMSDSCMQWNEDVMEPLTSDPPDLVFTTANVNIIANVPEGYIGQWEALEGRTEVLAVRDNPRMAEDIPACLEDDPEQCSIPRDKALSNAVPWENTDNIPDNASFADLSDYFCNDESCEPIIGNVLVYRDRHHITTLYSRTLAPALKEHVKEALEK